MTTGAVVLNYLDFESSIRCLRSIQRCNPQPQKIVIVDNASPNNSLAHLEKAVADFPNTSLIVAASNDGFSAGHNIGIQALQKDGCKNFVLATSDTEILTVDLFSKFHNVVASDVGVVGPQIKQPNGKPQNPSIESLSLRYFFSLLWFCWGRPGRNAWHELKQLQRMFFGAKNEEKYGAARTDLDRTSYAVYKLHGSFMMLTEEFVERVGLLDEDIFMFGEEDLISWRCELLGLKRVIAADCLVRHENDSSIESAHGRDSNKFVLEKENQSGRLLRKKIDFFQLFKRCLSK